MCGICGYVGVHRPELLEPMALAMRHRGPVSLIMHALRWFVNDHPIVMALTVVILAGVAIWVGLMWK